MKPRSLPLTALGAVASSALVVLVARPAHADEQSIIRLPGDHPQYLFEAEPHLLVGYAPPFDPGGDVGVGFRGTFNVANGFVGSINDSIGVGVGVDFAANDHVMIPIVMQWNFWLSTHWSVFGEPGVAFGAGDHDVFVPTFFAGGRLHFTDRIAMTIRIGYPAVSLGVSFLL